ncbi:MAG: ABC transporter permease [Thermoanaerobaculia bacterium]|nr:ABC transporter permease [Thermoanaerobaculia bacterium]
MSSFLALLQRELRAYFVSPLAWAVSTFFLFVQGLSFLMIVSFLSDPRAAGEVTPFVILFTSFFFWITLIFVTPMITMRLVSEERRSGTLEILLTSPLSETQMVLAKFCAAMIFWCFLWLPTVLYPLIIERYSDVDWGPVSSGYLGVLGLGSMFLAVGLFGSSFAKNQIVAAAATFAMMMVFFLVPWFGSLATGETLQLVFGYADLLSHMEDFSKGIVDSRRLVYYLTTTALFLFLTVRAVEAKKWR